ncbi:hypothetical protein FE784_20225 [Paenibacillus hemerocallicola]|uniref:Uncharacterized protein n=1 Tax=Paenibacillus hemerocallicola TaxID=1172614 RepID=A0A5C4T5V0_9BACL|nr:hypothetical protein [Paenibacillus hemerocallicola]TNJ64451.1 hypothetical protein FE784_20225 [Paenibacillus hemerocallicola]
MSGRSQTIVLYAVPYRRSGAVYGSSRSGLSLGRGYPGREGVLMKAVDRGVAECMEIRHALYGMTASSGL